MFLKKKAHTYLSRSFPTLYYFLIAFFIFRMESFTLFYNENFNWLRVYGIFIVNDLHAFFISTSNFQKTLAGA